MNGLYRGNLRGRIVVATLLTGILMGALLYASVQPDAEEVQLQFGSGNGFRTQGPTDTADAALEIVKQLGDAYIEKLEVSQDFGPVGGTVETPLLDVTVHTDPNDVNTTTIIVGDTEVTVAGVLEQIPLPDLEAILGDLPHDDDGGLPPIGGGEDPPPQDEPDEGFRVGNENDTYAYILIHEESSAVEVIVLATPNFGGLRVVANPWFVQHSDGEGNLIDLWVRNPFQAVELGDHVILQNINCVDGECVAKKQFRNVCKDLRPHCYGNGNIAIPTPDESGHVDALPDTILHVWSSDSLHGGAGISILDTHEAALAGPQWRGNPFTSEGLWVEHDGGLVATLHVELPSAAHHGLTVTVGGPVVEALTGAPVSQGADLSEFRIALDVGASEIDTDNLYALFDPLNAVLVGTWNDASGATQGLTISDLASGQPVFALMPGDDDSGVTISAGPLGVTIDEEGVGIEPAPEPIIGSVNEDLEPLATAIAQLRDLASGEVRGQVRLILGAAGCEDSARGCVGIVYDTVTNTFDDATGSVPGAPGAPGTPGVPGVPPLGGGEEGGEGGPDLGVDGVTVPNTDRYVQWVNGRAGTVLGYVPAPGTCISGTAALVDQCLAGTPAPLDAIGVIVGLLPAPGDGMAALPSADHDDGTVRIHDGEGYPLIQVSSGSLSVAGANAQWNDDLVTLRGPDGSTLCIGHTLDPNAPQGTFPSLTLGCDGLGGDHYTVQPGATYQTSQSGGIRSFSLHDPADPGSYLFHYHDDGTMTTISSSVHPATTTRVPSALVQVVGNPVTSPTFGVTLAGQALDTSPFGEIAFAKQVYHDGRALASTLPIGSEIEAVFAELDPPASTTKVNDGQTLVEGFAGNTWTSGLRDHAFTVTTKSADAPEGLAAAYAFGQAPSTTSPRAELALVSIDEKSDTRTYRGTVPANAMANAADGARLHFALVWTESHGPVSSSQWDDNGGAGYSYRLDMKGPSAAANAPTTSDASVFAVGWSGNAGTGAPLDQFRIQTQKGTTDSDGWTTWLEGRDASATQSADYTGSPGATHWFRAQACDAVGNCGPWSTPVSTQVAAPAAPVTGALATISVTQPTPGAVLDGVTALAWRVDYDGDATPVTNVHYQATGASTWKAIKSGADGQTTWDTRGLADGAYTLRFQVTDGQDDWTKTVPVTLANGNVDTLDPLRQAVEGQTQKVQGDPNQAPPSVDEGGKAEKKGSPGIGAIGIVLGVLGLLAVARRRRT